MILYAIYLYIDIIPIHKPSSLSSTAPPPRKVSKKVTKKKKRVRAPSTSDSSSSSSSSSSLPQPPKVILFKNKTGKRCMKMKTLKKILKNEMKFIWSPDYATGHFWMDHRQKYVVANEKYHLNRLAKRYAPFLPIFNNLNYFANNFNT